MSILSRATGKSYPSKPNDFWPTIDLRAIPPLLPHLPKACLYAEPCAGGGHLIDLLDPHGPICAWASDLAPQSATIMPCDIFSITADDLRHVDCIITNPPWSRKLLHPIIRHLLTLGKPAWLLFDAAWAFTQQASEHLAHCTHIAAIGRLRWIPDSSFDPPTDYAWYCFDGAPTAATHQGSPRFFPKPCKEGCMNPSARPSP